MTTYRDAAAAKFKLLINVLNPDSKPSFWRVAHSFDTVIDYFDNVDHNHAGEVADLVLANYKKDTDGGYGGIWFDDFGWWTIATYRAEEKSFFSSYKDQFRAVRVECWKHFTENAPFVWDRHKPGMFDEYGPSVEGGVWNEYWDGTPSKYTGPKDGNPSLANQQGVQNTISNVLYLIAALRLGAVDKDAKSAADKEYDFVAWWLWGGGGLKPPTLWWESKKLVREQVSHFYGGKPKAPGFEPEWAWTGDQGLVLGGLADRLRFGGSDPRALGTAKSILDGAKANLVDANNILRPWSGSGTNPVWLDGFEPDYETGVGVFWRYACP